MVGLIGEVTTTETTKKKKAETVTAGPRCESTRR
jgi:hypothetical protein